MSFAAFNALTKCLKSPDLTPIRKDTLIKMIYNFSSWVRFFFAGLPHVPIQKEVGCKTILSGMWSVWLKKQQKCNSKCFSDARLILKDGSESS